MSFLYSQLFVSLPKPTTSCKGKTILITGSNTGLGKEAARHFVTLGASTVILAVRNLQKGEAAKSDIELTTKCSPSIIKVVELDMSQYSSVITFASHISKTESRLDIALLNAGTAKADFSVAQGQESNVTVNVISTFLLALLLLPKLKATSAQFNVRPTLTIVSSEVHAWAEFTERHADNIFDRLAQNDNVDMGERYQVTKLLEALAVRAITDRKPASQIPVTINYVNPGLCHSELARDLGFGLMVLKLLLARSTEYGSRTLVHAALAGAESHGQYMSDCRVQQPSAWVVSGEGYETQERVWGELSTILEGIVPGVMGNL